MDKSPGIIEVSQFFRTSKASSLELVGRASCIDGI